MSLRARAAVLCVLASCALAAPAHARWEEQGLGSPGWDSQNAKGLAITSDGDTIAVWEERQGDTWRTMLGVFPTSGLATADELGPHINTSGLATDAAGNAVAMYTTGDDRDIRWRERPAGGTFAPPQALGLPDGDQALGATVAMNAHGDIAFVWGRSGSLWAAIRPAGQVSFGAPEELGPLGPGYWPEITPRLTDEGELLVVWINTVDSAERPQLQAVHRSPGGAVSAVQTIATPSTDSSNQVASDADGRAVITWEEEPHANWFGKTKMAIRDPGGDFRPTAFPGSGPATYQPRAAGIATGGPATIAYTTPFGLRVYSGPFGGPYRRLHTYRSGNDVRVEASPGGRTLLAWTTYDHVVTTQRSGNGDFGPVEDLRESCAGLSLPGFQIDDAGHTAALWGGLYGSPDVILARGDSGPGHQGCVAHELYGGPDVENPPPHGGAGGGAWVALGPSEAPDRVLGNLRLPRPKLSGTGAKRTISVRASCHELCYVFGSITIPGPNGRVLQKTTLSGAGTGAGGKLAYKQEFKLNDRVRRKLAGRALRVELRLRLGDMWNRRIARSFDLTGEPLPD